MEEDSVEDTREEKTDNLESNIMSHIDFFFFCSLLKTIETKSNIELNNGGTTNIANLLVTEKNLRAVHSINPLAVKELIKKYNDTSSTFHENSSGILKRYQLIDNNHDPHPHKKDIIFSMVTEDGSKITLVSPVPLIEVGSE